MSALPDYVRQARSNGRRNVCRFVRAAVLAGVQLRDLIPTGIEFQMTIFREFVYGSTNPALRAFRKFPDLCWQVRSTRPGVLPDRVLVEVTGAPTCHLDDCEAWEILAQGGHEIYLAFDFHGRLMFGPFLPWWQAKLRELRSKPDLIYFIEPIRSQSHVVDRYSFRLFDDVLLDLNFNPRLRIDDYEIQPELLHQIDREWGRAMVSPTTEAFRSFWPRFRIEPPAERPDWWPFPA